MSEVIFIIGLLAGLIGWTLLLKGVARLYWLITMGVIGATVGIMEVVAKCVEGRTISQLFWVWSVDNVVLAYVAMAMLIGGMMLLAIHLLWKVWFDRNYKKGG
jgi:hypothetical protein